MSHELNESEAFAVSHVVSVQLYAFDLTDLVEYGLQCTLVHTNMNIAYTEKILRSVVSLVVVITVLVVVKVSIKM